MNEILLKIKEKLDIYLIYGLSIVQVDESFNELYKEFKQFSSNHQVLSKVESKLEKLLDVNDDSNCENLLELLSLVEAILVVQTENVKYLELETDTTEIDFTYMNIEAEKLDLISENILTVAVGRFDKINKNITSDIMYDFRINELLIQLLSENYLNLVNLAKDKLVQIKSKYNEHSIKNITTELTEEQFATRLDIYKKISSEFNQTVINSTDNSSSEKATIIACNNISSSLKHMLPNEFKDIAKNLEKKDNQGE